MKQYHKVRIMLIDILTREQIQLNAHEMYCLLYGYEYSFIECKMRHMLSGTFIGDCNYYAVGALYNGMGWCANKFDTIKVMSKTLKDYYVCCGDKNFYLSVWNS